MASFRADMEVCPTCGQRGSCSVHAYYKRHLVDFVNGHVVCVQIRITRVICGSCGHTHAIHPDTIVPYESHSLFFILRVLGEYSLRRMSIEKLCRRYDISLKTLYRWRDLFRKHQREWQGYMTSMETTLKQAIHAIASFDPFQKFASDFFNSTGLSFLQRHANPASNRRGAPPRKSFFS